MGEAARLVVGSTAIETVEPGRAIRLVIHGIPAFLGHASLPESSGL